MNNTNSAARQYFERQYELYSEVAVDIKTPSVSKKFMPLEMLLQNIDLHKSMHEVVVVASGAFTIPHYGHADYFEQAKSLGDVLVVCMNNDNSIRENNRCTEFVPSHGRLVSIAMWQPVDYVVLFEEKTPETILGYLKPAVFTKGIEWKDRTLPEQGLIEANGGRVEFITPRYDFSSTTLAVNVINNDKRANGK